MRVCFALYRTKFDLVLRRLKTILLVQDIREPNHADLVIGHLVVYSHKWKQKSIADSYSD